jgi:hypothetical protein
MAIPFNPGYIVTSTPGAGARPVYGGGNYRVNHYHARGYRPRRLLPTAVPPGEPVAPAALPAQRGVAAAIIFDWALLTLFLTLLVVTAVRYGLADQRTAAVALLAVIFIPMLGFLAEALRRGRQGARLAQIVVSSLAAIGNTAGFLRDLLDVLHGRLPGGVSTIALAADIWILWGLTRPATVAWFAGVSPAVAQRRYGGKWLALALAASLAIGIGATVLSLRG